MAKKSMIAREAKRQKLLEEDWSAHFAVGMITKDLHCLQDLARDLGIRNVRYEGERTAGARDESTAGLIRDASKCIKCRRCVSVCAEVQDEGAIFPQDRGFDTVIGPAFDNELDTVACVHADGQYAPEVLPALLAAERLHGRQEQSHGAHAGGGAGKAQRDAALFVTA